MGASDAQTVKAFLEAEAYDGPSLIIAYSHCIAHGFDLVEGLLHQKDAVESGAWPLFRYNPDLLAQGKNPLKLDSKPPKIRYADYALKETRFRMLTKSHPENAQRLLKAADEQILWRWRMYEQLAAMAVDGGAPAPAEESGKA
jgi:pyruvate-ferredoxin/flavodoxin oxidoreductase